MKTLKYILYFNDNLEISHSSKSNSVIAFRSGRIYSIYVKIINGKVYFCEKEDDKPIWSLCSLNCFETFYNGSVEKYFHNLCFVLKN